MIDIVEGIEDEGTTMMLSEVFEDITFIPLETTDECLIGNTILGIHFSKDYIVIVDRTPRQILLFDKTGKFIRKIGNRGQGPGEYLSPFLSVLVNDELFIWDIGLNATLCYDLHTGKCLRVKKHDSYDIRSMKNFNDSLLIYYYGLPEREDLKEFYHIQTLSLDFENIDMLWHEKMKLPLRSEQIDENYRRVCTYLKDGIFHVLDPNVDDETVFYMDRKLEKIPAYKLHSGKYNAYGKSSGEKYDIYSIKETDRFLFVNGGLREKRHARRILYDKTTGKSRNIIFNLDFNDWGFHNDIDGSIPFWPSGYACDNILFDHITPERLKSLMSHPYYRTIEVKNKEKHQAIKDYLDSAEEDANPVIFLATLKTE
ncbi:MAG: 6-bladed beta-propeller [Prevotellaceae bacterium]|nr:6-bladed beta-propeller [Prevotellaceae bacterium]